MSPLIAVSVGEPAGIGPDIVLQFWASNPQAPLLVFADPLLLEQRAAMLGIAFSWQQGQQASGATEAMRIQPHSLKAPCFPGQLNPLNATYVIECLTAASFACLQQQCAALVTGPIHKAVINEGGIAFSGHTEFLAALCQVKRSIMLFTSPLMRMALMTTHLPLAKVASTLTYSLVYETLCLLHQEMKRCFNLPRPRLLVCGLNPHAGEDGLLGREELDILIPAIIACRSQGISIEGPVPADSAFLPNVISQYDVVVAMYHDQGLPVLKAQGFGNTVNITLGLPIIRTSVDHGTALPLAGTGKACYDSFASAVHSAMELISHAH